MKGRRSAVQQLLRVVVPSYCVGSARMYNNSSKQIGGGAKPRYERILLHGGSHEHP
jgi:hypothetical protein